MSTLAEISKQVNRQLNGIRQAFRGVLTRVNSTGAAQAVQAEALNGEPLQDVELFQQYGLTSNPPAGTAAIMLPLNGKTSHSIVIATEHGQYRLQGLKSGEVAIYTDEKAKIVLKRGRIIEIDCDIYRVNCLSFEVNASDKADFNTPMLTASEQMTAKAKITGQGGMAISGGNGGVSATIDGTLKATQDIVAGTVSVQKHIHNGDSGGTTSPPKQ
ncbi:phage baseplate assembly protein V [Limnobaculum zhutongyuii]|uniref:Phage baseplate assembly protein V n=1 Tax=Limnobaculum zhutongyuii TaxID=2498113 RepID=A0A411WGS1_9GAMM|nr:phage baseplate assembly protein V [Limnobaculum zhutongyuii]QBH95458.1 phage baseplate assembly protein V [Limnobaculum zhutongyuii]TQS88853.1 phage baseplate assembly protein V [Limnobaculum zhutongyuii]